MRPAKVVLTLFLVLSIAGASLARGTAEPRIREPATRLDATTLRKRVAIEPDVSEVELELTAIDRTDVRFRELSATGWKDVAAFEWRRAGDRDVAVLKMKAGDVTCVAPTGRETVRLDANGQLFAGMMLIGARGQQGDEVVVREYRLWMRAQTSPMTWAAGTSAYETVLLLALREVDPPVGLPAGSSALPWPLKVTFSGTSARVPSEAAVIRGLGVSGAAQAAVSCASHLARPLVTAISDLGEADLELEVAAELGSLEVTSPKATILGFGLEETPLTVFRFAEDGRPWSPDRPLLVSLRATAGNPSASIEIPAGSDRGSGTFRSEGSEGTTITASVLPVVSRPLAIEFSWPWMIVLAPLIGGAFGSAADWLRLKKEERKTTFPVRMVLGTFTALVIALCGLLGVVVLGLPANALTTAGGQLLVALVAGFLGIKLVEKVVLKLLPGFETKD